MKLAYSKYLDLSYQPVKQPSDEEGAALRANQALMHAHVQRGGRLSRFDSLSVFCSIFIMQSASFGLEGDPSKCTDFFID